jgi:hypothetical protein
MVRSLSFTPFLLIIIKKKLYLEVLVQGRSRVLATGAYHVGYCGLAQVLLRATEQVLTTLVGH